MEFVALKVFRKLIIVMFSICIILIFGEIMAGMFAPQKNRLERILDILEQDSMLFWKQKKNLDIKFEGAKVHTNSLGLRNKEAMIKKGNDVFRIICLGASPTFGWGVKEEQTYSYQLENLLKKIILKNKKLKLLMQGLLGIVHIKD